MVLTDEQWAVLGPLIERVKPKGKTLLVHLRRTVEAIIWRCTNGAKWRSIHPSSARGGQLPRPSSAGAGSVCGSGS